MAGLHLKAFGGFVPRVASHLLQDNEGQKAVNTKLYSGTLRSWKKPASLDPVVAVDPATKTIYAAKNVSGDNVWMAWNNEVDVVNSPIQSETQAFTIYYTGDGVPKKTNATLCGTSNGGSPVSWLNMGVAAPATAPTVTRVGTGASPESRVYVYTYVNTFGDIEEESAPSPVSAIVLCGTGDTVTVNGFAAAPTSGYNITKKRIYRSTSGTQTTSFQFVAEIAVGATSFTDNIASAGLGEQLQTLQWETPPANLHSIVALPNGYLAGLSGSDVCFSEVNAPHAWPSAYRLTIPFEPVGLGVFGQSLVMMTKGNPYVLSGISPESTSAEKVPMVEPCVSKRSITQDMMGVTYASPNGLILIGAGGPSLITENILLKDEFQKYNPESLRSAFFAGKYFAFYSDSATDITNGALILDRNLPATPLSITSITSSSSFVDPATAKLYIVDSNEIKVWEGDENNTLPYEWRSKRWVFTAPDNMAALEVEADFSNISEGQSLQNRVAEIIAANQAIWASGAKLLGVLNSTQLNTYEVNGSLLQTIPTVVDNRYLLVEVYVDDKLIHSKQYTKRGVYRMPSGYKGQIFEVKINGNIELRYIKMASSAKELKAL
jgi:hypothetical protein